ncbi:MAG TPA: hypothetical protein VGN81_34685 [Pseudonocardiaceae bacterium]
MPFSSVLGVAIFLGVVGGVILYLLWPGPKQGLKVLQRCGIAQPSDADVADAVRYLKRRRIWYPWLFFLLPLLADAAGMTKQTTSGVWSLVWTLLIGGLLGELFALRPQRSSRKTVMLARRRLIDLAPVPALAVLGFAVAGGVVETVLDRQWAELGVVVVCALASVAILIVTLVRPVAGNPVVDEALRVRSARLAIAFAIAVPATLPQQEMNVPKGLFFLVCLFALLYLTRSLRSVATPAS